MRIPTIRGVIDRRILVNFRVAPAAIKAVLPPPFRPQQVHGFAIAGICLIRLKQIRPVFLPSFLGFASENAAHRIAVEWDGPDGVRSGVYIPRRDTSSSLNALAGGRLFPGVHHLARFDVHEAGDQYEVNVRGENGASLLKVKGRAHDALPADSVFTSLDEASRFFESGSLGYSPSHRDGEFDGLELRSRSWQVEPLEVDQVESTFFADEKAFPSGSVTLDNALLMRGIQHEWRSRESLSGTACPIC